MTPEQIANIEAAKKRRAALNKPAPTGKSSISDKQKIELALKAINDYQRARQDPESLSKVLSGIFAKTPGDPELRNYSLNYDKNF